MVTILTVLLLLPKAAEDLFSLRTILKLNFPQNPHIKVQKPTYQHRKQQIEIRKKVKKIVQYQLRYGIMLITTKTSTKERIAL